MVTDSYHNFLIRWRFACQVSVIECLPSLFSSWSCITNEQSINVLGWWCCARCTARLAYSRARLGGGGQHRARYVGPGVPPGGQRLPRFFAPNKQRRVRLSPH